MFSIPKKTISLRSHIRDVAQSGLEYASGGRGVASSNLVIPTLKIKDLQNKTVSLFI